MTSNDAIDRMLDDWFAVEAAAPAPRGLLDLVTSTSAQRRPRPGWLATVRGDWVGAERNVRERTSIARTVAYLIVLVGVVLALVAGGLIVGGSLPTPRTPTTHAPDLGPFLPAELPEGIASGTVATPLGTARWVHLDGGQSKIPYGTIVPGPTGLLMSSVEGGPVALWASADGIDWAERPLPIHAGSATLTLADATYWIVTADPTTLWRSTDASTWEQLDLGALVPPTPADLNWELTLGTPVSARGTTVLPVSHRVRDPGLLLGQPPTYRDEWPEEGPGRLGVYRVIQGTPRGSMEVGVVRIEETLSGLRIVAEDDTTITELEGSTSGSSGRGERPMASHSRASASSRAPPCGP